MNKTKELLQKSCKNSLVVLITNARITETTVDMIKEGKLGKDLVVVSGDLFTKFFNSAVGESVLRYFPKKL